MHRASRLTQLLAKAQSSAASQGRFHATARVGPTDSHGNAAAPGIQLMAMVSLMMVKGIVQSVAGAVIDIVPPLIPPPVWINRCVNESKRARQRSPVDCIPNT